MPPIDKLTSPVAVMSVSIRSALNIAFSSELPSESMFRNAPASVSSVVDQMSYRCLAPEEIFNTGVLRHHEIEGAGSADMLQRENVDMNAREDDRVAIFQIGDVYVDSCTRVKGSP